ncbi:MAG TPA: tetratricopeptide repeat protein [Pyrinomonadaceae bacterium]|jgi:superkiller protein 3|nr:tetratricopeptide repeat protein [Pyrinomonadaceae bacterium]
MRVARAILSALLVSVLLQTGCTKKQANKNAGASPSNNAAQQQGATPAPDDARALFERGVDAYHHDRDQEAVEDFQRAVELDPDFAEAFYRLGLALHVTGQKEESDKAFGDAIKAYEKLTRQDPKNADAYYFLGLCYEKLDKFEDAARALRESVRNSPEGDENRDDKYYELAVVQYKLAQYDDAVAALNKALEINPDNYPAADLLEKAKAGAQRVEEIRRHQEQMLKQKNGNANMNGNANANANGNAGVNANRNAGAGANRNSPASPL